MRTKTHPFDPAEYLGTLEAQAEYISAALETGDPAFIADSLGVVARARGMSQLARDTGLRRESLYKALSAEGNPEFATIMKVVQALGVKLSAEAA
jgi:probable addiction module antidote protein